MKASAIIRICVWSVVALILCGILLGGIGLSYINWDAPKISFGGYTFKDADSYAVGATTLPSGTVHSIDIDWVAGSILVAVGEGDDIIVRESHVDDERDALRWRVRDGELQIRYCKPRRTRDTPAGKNLEILLPASMFEENGRLWLLDIENVFSTINVRDITLDMLDIESVSGHIDISCASIREMDIETVSGNIIAQGEIREVSLEGVSATLTVYAAISPDSISVETVSGTVNLHLPADRGFRLKHDSVSGNIHAPDFAMSVSGNGEYLCGDGYTEIEIEGVSANVNIHKKS